ncbi:prosaposin-like [Anneissia japonica]|uniref:prosaposin-like n=1 Tax=Anneissia japonica TaxID=1529436 RepID=UPI0014254FE2|nr:prosaposin-like [Anneissia japonica]
MMTLTLAKPILKFKDDFVAKANVVPAIEMSQAQPVPRKLEESTICTVCELVVNELDRLLSDNATEDEIISAVEKVCDQLPSAFKTECNALVSQYGAALIELLVQKIKPDEICMKLNLCTGKGMCNIHILSGNP